MYVWGVEQLAAFSVFAFERVKSLSLSVNGFEPHAVIMRIFNKGEHEIVICFFLPIAITVRNDCRQKMGTYNPIRSLRPNDRNEYFHP